MKQKHELLHRSKTMQQDNAIRLIIAKNYILGDTSFDFKAENDISDKPSFDFKKAYSYLVFTGYNLDFLSIVSPITIEELNENIKNDKDLNPQTKKEMAGLIKKELSKEDYNKYASKTAIYKLKVLSHLKIDLLLNVLKTAKHQELGQELLQITHNLIIKNHDEATPQQLEKDILEFQRNVYNLFINPMSNHRTQSTNEDLDFIEIYYFGKNKIESKIAEVLELCKDQNKDKKQITSTETPQKNEAKKPISYLPIISKNNRHLEWSLHHYTQHSLNQKPLPLIYLELGKRFILGEMNAGFSLNRVFLLREALYFLEKIDENSQYSKITEGDLSLSENETNRIQNNINLISDIRDDDQFNQMKNTFASQRAIQKMKFLQDFKIDGLLTILANNLYKNPRCISLYAQTYDLYYNLVTTHNNEVDADINLFKRNMLEVINKFQQEYPNFSNETQYTILIKLLGVIVSICTFGLANWLSRAPFCSSMFGLFSNEVETKIRLDELNARLNNTNEKSTSVSANNYLVASNIAFI